MQQNKFKVFVVECLAWQEVLQKGFDFLVTQKATGRAFKGVFLPNTIDCGFDSEENHFGFTELAVDMRILFVVFFSKEVQA